MDSTITINESVSISDEIDFIESSNVLKIFSGSEEAEKERKREIEKREREREMEKKEKEREREMEKKERERLKRKEERDSR